MAEMRLCDALSGFLRLFMLLVREGEGREYDVSRRGKITALECADAPLQAHLTGDSAGHTSKTKVVYSKKLVGFEEMDGAQKRSSAPVSESLLALSYL